MATKLYIPPPRRPLVARGRLLERLDAGIWRRLTLVSAPAGFGKTTLLGEWVAGLERPAAWVSLDEGDNELGRFLSYVVAALQTVAPDVGDGVLGALASSQSPPVEALLTRLVNELAQLQQSPVLVLDDFHVIEARQVQKAVAFLVAHLPPQAHLVLATREDPPLPLPRLRARGQLTELRAADLRFTEQEAATFLNEVMDLALEESEVSALEARTEGWIAGLQLAAISMRGQENVEDFIASFTGSHRFVLDYLMEEVLAQQPQEVQIFLLRTSILERLCGELCEAVVGERKKEEGRRKREEKSGWGREALEYLEGAGLFLVSLDDERRWYRYHHLFRDLLRQRLAERVARVDEEPRMAELHVRASRWFEAHGLELDAFRHAVAADDVARAQRLMEGGGMPLHFRGAVRPVLDWLALLPETVLDERPSLWVMYASALSMSGQTSEVEPRLQAAEAALEGREQDEQTRNLIGHIAAIRALLAAIQYEVEAIITQSERALEYLAPHNLPVRTATTWKLGFAYQLRGERAAAAEAYRQAIAACEATGNVSINLSATIGLGQVLASQTRLHEARAHFRRALELAGDPPQPIAGQAHLELAQVCYEWNDLEAAQEHGERAVLLLQKLEKSDQFVACKVFLARLALARGDAAGATVILARAEQEAREKGFSRQLPEIMAARVRVLLHEGKPSQAEKLAQTQTLPIVRVRVALAQGHPPEALAILERVRREAEQKDWDDERLEALVLEAVARQANGEGDAAVGRLGEALALAQPAGFVRLFVDEGAPVAQLLPEVAARGAFGDYVGELLAAFEDEEGMGEEQSGGSPGQEALVEPLTARELEVLALVAQGLSNREIGERLFIALNTVKGHNRRIFGKLQVGRRTEAVARARELGLL
ncbi:MAG: LuxR C-terminal-related transcriptional regulator [Chloroflexota bacterium]